MSLEAALDEERREILDILEGRKHATQPPPRSTCTGSPARAAPPVAPVRSMLDVAPDPGAQRHGSIAGIGVGVTQPNQHSRTSATTAPKSAGASGVRSMLEPIAPSPLRLTQSATSSPTTDTAPSYDAAEAHRRSSDSSTKGLGLPEIKKKQGVDPQQDYQFEMLPSIPSALPKRVTQGGKLGHHNNAMHSNSMAAVMSGGELGTLPPYTRGRQIGRRAGLPGQSSRSPTSRLARSQSPGTKLLNNNSMNLMTTPGKFVTDSGKVINMDHAYRRLTNAALSRSGGSLASYPGASSKLGEGADGAADGEARLQKDYYSDTPDGGFSEDYTSEEIDDTSSGEDVWKSDIYRGRRRIRRKGGTDQAGKGSKTGEKKPVQSLLAAAEEERAYILGEKFYAFTWKVLLTR